MTDHAATWHDVDEYVVKTLVAEPANAAIALANLTAAGVGDRVELMSGPASVSAAGLIAAETEPFDLIFIDADKQSNAEYLATSVKLTRPGSVIVGDNVVRHGGVANAASDDPRIKGVRAFLEATAAHPQLDGTAIQTVGSKGWDGFALAIVRA